VALFLVLLQSKLCRYLPHLTSRVRLPSLSPRLYRPFHADTDAPGSLAAEYRLRLIYKKQFNDILTEEAPSRDFGPLLGKMGVLNDQGESMMDGDQWEAASE
jgi:hypothetical protein